MKKKLSTDESAFDVLIGTDRSRSSRSVSDPLSVTLPFLMALSPVDEPPSTADVDDVFPPPAYMAQPEEKANAPRLPSICS